MRVGGLEVENVEELSFTLISIREASEELSFGDGVGVVLTAAWECGGKAAELRSIVDSCKGEFLPCSNFTSAITNQLAELGVAVVVGFRRV